MVFGRAVSVLFAKEGANLVISYLNEHEDANMTKQIVESFGRKCILISADLRDENQYHRYDRRKDPCGRPHRSRGGRGALARGAAFAAGTAGFGDETPQELSPHPRTSSELHADQDHRHSQGLTLSTVRVSDHEIRCEQSVAGE